MNNLFQYVFFLALISFVWFSCSTKPDFPDEPKIEFVQLSKSEINQGDTLWVKLNFEDGDGNLGKEIGLSANCKTNCEFTSDSSCFLDPFYGAFLIDMRDSCFVFHDLPDFEPNGNIKAVSGELFLNIPPVFCKLANCPSCTKDTLVYKIIVRDVSNNLSNSVLTDTIFIKCS